MLDTGYWMLDVWVLSYSHSLPKPYTPEDSLTRRPTPFHPSTFISSFLHFFISSFSPAPQTVHIYILSYQNSAADLLNL